MKCPMHHMNDDINIPMIPRAKFVAENSLTVEKTLVGTLVNANEMLLTIPVINIAQLTILIDNLILNCVSPSFLQLHGYYTN